jgi:cytochrome c553
MKRALFVMILAASTAALNAADAKRVERGKYLVMVAACHDCHTPKANPMMALDTNRLLSGRPGTTAAPNQPAVGQISASGDLTAWYGPWGVSYAANITPDLETGIGKRYTEAAFIKTLRTGKKPEGEPLLPPMPWQMIGQMTDEDLKSIYAYLRSVKPVKNFVRSAAPVVASKGNVKSSGK